MELIKTAVRVGNSAGVLLPKKWINSQVKVSLEPLNLKEDILNILIDKKILGKLKGIYLIGSYARKEQTIESDVDVLAITSNIDKRIKKEKYEIICISEKQLKKQLKENIFPILPMLKEAKPILNSELLFKYKNAKITKKNLKWYIETTKSAMGIVKASIELSKKENKNEGDETAYSLILRLRTLYIIDCIIKNKQYKKKDFLILVKNLTESLIAYERYLSSKNKNTSERKLPIKQAEKLMNYINKKVRQLEK
jgi:predicted nucleotidyltransferase